MFRHSIFHIKQTPHLRFHCRSFHKQKSLIQVNLRHFYLFDKVIHILELIQKEDFRFYFYDDFGMSIVDSEHSVVSEP